VVAGGLALVAGALRGGPAPAAAQSSLQGTPWLALFCADSSGRLLPVPFGVEITATFQAGRVTGSAGCNQYMAGYQLAQDTAGIMRISQVASTQRFCADPPGVMEQETAYLQALQRVGRYAVVNDRLLLRTLEGGALVLYMPQPQQSLEGTEWVAINYNNGREAVVSILSGTEITATFAESRVAGSAGCNRYTAGYTLGPDAGAISVSPPASTRILCTEPAGVMEQEAAFLAALQSAARYRIEGAQLVLEQAGGARAATFDARGA
jgi:heat shock protein HslJ